jgi:hypothetical protein
MRSPLLASQRWLTPPHQRAAPQSVPAQRAKTSSCRIHQEVPINSPADPFVVASKRHGMVSAGAIAVTGFG